MKLILNICTYSLLYLGPLDHTVNDFWRMVWQCECGKIVMLTNIFEEGKVNTNCLEKNILKKKLCTSHLNSGKIIETYTNISDIGKMN